MRDVGITQITFLAYDGMTLLDLVGPFEVLTMWPGVDVRVAALKAGPIAPDSRSMPVIAPHDLSSIRAPDIVVVPGGPTPVEAKALVGEIDWLRLVGPRCKHVFSVCTGAFLLGEAGLLSNRRATTHWATLDGLEAYGAIPVADRWVCDDNILTAAGVSAGLDAALQLTIAERGDTLAKAIQLLIEYDPSPPIDCGSLDKAGPEVVAFLASAEGARLSERKQRRPSLR